MKKNIMFIFLILAIVAILITGIYIVWLNRGDTKLVTNFVSFLLLGSLGLLISSFISLSALEIENSYFGNIIYNIKSKNLLPHSKILNPHKYSDNFDPILSSLDGLPNSSSDESNFELHLISKYISFLLGSNFSNSWFAHNHNYLYDGKVSFSSNLQILDQDDIESIKNAVEVGEIFIPINSNEVKTEFLETYTKGNNPNKGERNKLFNEFRFINPFSIKFPPNTKIRTIKINDCCNKNEVRIEFKNPYITYSIIYNFGPVVPNGVDKISNKLGEILNLAEAQRMNSKCVPFNLFSVIRTNKWRQGNPKMEMYINWAKRVDKVLEDGLSNEILQLNLQ